MELGDPVMLGINTAFLYLLAAAFVVLLVFLFFRRRRRMAQLEKRGETGGFERMPRGDKLLELKRLLRRFPELEEGLTWLDTQLMRAVKEPYIQVELRQAWCCLDRTGQAQVPARCRPCELVFSTNGWQERRPLTGFREEEFLTRDENKLLSWGILERCRTLIPFRVYRMEVRRTTRRFRLGESVPAGWRQPEAVMEEYTVQITK